MLQRPRRNRATLARRVLIGDQLGVDTAPARPRSAGVRRGPVAAAGAADALDGASLHEAFRGVASRRGRGREHAPARACGRARVQLGVAAGARCGATIRALEVHQVTRCRAIGLAPCAFARRSNTTSAAMHDGIEPARAGRRVPAERRRLSPVPLPSSGRCRDLDEGPALLGKRCRVECVSNQRAEAYCHFDSRR
jgi:hypothetical protein